MTSLDALKEALRTAYATHVGRPPACALIDFPDYNNVGDSAIWLGQVQLLRRAGIPIRYVSTLRDYSPDALRHNLPSGGAVLITGGGNFGTLYPAHQSHREKVLRDLADYTVVQLPQSLCYEDDGAIARTAQVASEHRDFTLLVRDEASLRFGLERLGVNTALCPDSALMLHSVVKRQAPSTDCLILARSDKETVGVDWPREMARHHDGMSYEVADWQADRLTPMLRTSQLLRSKLRPVSYRAGLGQNFIERTYTWTAQERVAQGIALLSRGKVVITDRLHGMILCVTAGIPCVAIDNSNGKVLGFHRQWLADVPGCMTATSVTEAIALAHEVAKGSRST